MEQDKLKKLLTTTVAEIEANRFSSLEEIIGMVAQAFQEIMPVSIEKSG